MNFTIQELKKKDHKKAIQAAVKGMHFDWYVDNTLLQYLYGRYFWYMELMRATQVIALYEDHKFAGVLLAEFNGEPRKYHSFKNFLYVKLFQAFQSLFARGGANVYDEANQELLNQYQKTKKPDGEIIFLAANPERTVKGIGTRLIQELEKQKKGKTVYLYTDNACTYQFYEHRGFERVGQKEIVLKLLQKRVELLCLLYSKTL